MRQDPRAKRKVIIATWERLGRRPVGEKVLRGIQRALRGQFGANGTESPAAIARVLADEGTELLHPEVIEFDARWREAAFRKQKTVDIDRPQTAERLPTFAQTIQLIKKLEKTRAESAGDKANLRQVRELAITAKQRAEGLARNERLSARVRAEQAEVAEWIRVWLQTPSLFFDWLDLRRQTSDFREKFAQEKS